MVSTVTSKRSKRWIGRVLASVGLVALLASSAGGVSQPVGAATGDITVLGAGVSGFFPRGGLVEGPDGHLWFGNQSGNLGRINPATNTITMYPIAGPTNIPDLAVGGDGNIWFTTSTYDKVGRFNPTTGTYDFFDTGVTWPSRITTAADGTLWVLGSGNRAARVNLNGSIGPSTISFGSAGDIILGPDDFIWVSFASQELIRINPADGSIQRFETDDQGDTAVDPRQMVVGPDGHIWFTYSGGAGGRGGVGRYVVATDTFTYFSDPVHANNKGITFGPDGNVWYLDATGSAAVRMTTTGSRTRFTATGWTVGTTSPDIVFGPGGSLWAGGSNRVARIDPGTPIDPACLPPAFTDVGTSHPFFAEICWMDREGISTGYQPGPTYRPSVAVSRQAMSAFMYRLAGEPAFTPPPPNATTFGDVSATNGFYLEIEWMASEDITTGTAASPKPLYLPSAPVSRGAMSAFMYRLAGEPPFSPGSPSFTDVGSGHPFFAEIEWMADAEISTGYLPGPTYRPGTAVSRQAMSAFMNRLAPLLTD